MILTIPTSFLFVVLVLLAACSLPIAELPVNVGDNSDTSSLVQTHLHAKSGRRRTHAFQHSRSHQDRSHTKQNLAKTHTKAKKEAIEKAVEVVEKANKVAEEGARQVAEERAKKEAEEKAKHEAREKAKENTRKMAEARARKEAEEKARKEAEEASRKAAEKAKEEAEEKAKKDAEKETQTPKELVVVDELSGFAHTDRPEDLVQLLAGTGTDSSRAPSDGNTLPQVKMPYGMNDWVPQTAQYRGAWFFSRKDRTFEAMRLTHQPSPWIGDYASLTLRPSRPQREGEQAVNLANQRSSALAYAPDSTTFRPYLFSTKLGEEGSQDIFELAPTSRAASIRLKFPSGTAERSLTLETSDWSNAEITAVDGMIRGSTDCKGGMKSNTCKMYFAMKVAPKDASQFTNATTDGSRFGVLHFTSVDSSAVTVNIATSFISVVQARTNMQNEIGARSFGAVAETGRQTWRTALSSVKATTPDSTQLSVFYTNLWKSMLFPRYLHEIDDAGKEVHYSPYTNKVHPGKLVADSGFWDAYISVYTLQSIVNPSNFGGLISGWVNAYMEAGWLPTWASPEQVNSMVGTMGDVVLADAIVKAQWGLTSGFDVEEAYNAIIKDANVVPTNNEFGRAGLRSYLEYGYIPDGRRPEAVSRSLNYYVADAAIARAAAALGKKNESAKLKAQSLKYSRLFNTERGFFQPKNEADKFTENFDPLAWGGSFTEGGGWQYRFYAPHDVPGLTKLYGGQQQFCSAVETMFKPRAGQAFHVGGYGQEIHEMTELQSIARRFGVYAHGNQPVHHVLWVAKKAGCNALADKYLRSVMQELYTVNGWAGDEDNGEMASWYVLASLGLFQIAGGVDELVVGSPAVASAIVALPGNRELRVLAENQSKDNVYVESATWQPQGKAKRPVVGNVLKFTEVMQGGTLQFILSPDPSVILSGDVVHEAESRPVLLHKSKRNGKRKRPRRK